MQSPNLSLTYRSDTSISSFFCSHLQKDLIVDLIHGADLGGWMKHENELQPDEFWSAILWAVIDSFRNEAQLTKEQVSDIELLELLLEQLGIEICPKKPMKNNLLDGD